MRDLHEWTRYFTAKTCLPKHQPIAVAENLSPDQLIDLANNRQEWERYLKNIHDTKVAKGFSNLQGALGGLTNMRKLYVINGHLMRTHRGVKKTTDSIHAPEALIHYRGESLYNDGPVGPIQRPGVHAFVALQRFDDIKWQLTKLRLDAVCWSVFSSKIGVIPSLQQLQSLYLQITIRFEHHWGDSQYREHSVEVGLSLRDVRAAFHQHRLREFLVGLPKLQSLKLDLGADKYAEVLTTLAPSLVADVLAVRHTWSDLRKLSLRCFYTQPKTLLALLKRHRSTLRVLKLHNVLIDTFLGPGPLEILATIHKTLQLERAKLSGNFSGEQTWDLSDTSLARAVEEYLVHGGTCPLNATNSRD